MRKGQEGPQEIRKEPSGSPSQWYGPTFGPSSELSTGLCTTSIFEQKALFPQPARAGEEQLGAAQSSILFIDPTQAVKATLSLHDFFSKLKGAVRVCDAYVDNTTLEHLYALDKGVTVQLLTKNVRDSGPLRRIVAAWKSEGRNLEIRVDGSAPLHDRYIIDDSSMMILGTSLNGFGKKQCFIIQTGPDLRDVLISVFDGLWKSATVWP